MPTSATLTTNVARDVGSSKLTRRARRDLLGERGATMWRTGLPASRRSTIATALEERIARGWALGVFARRR